MSVAGFIYADRVGFYYLTGYSCFDFYVTVLAYCGFSSTYLGECFSISSFFAFSASFVLASYLAFSSCSFCLCCCSFNFLSLSLFAFCWECLIYSSSLTRYAFTSFWWMICLSLFSCSIWCFYNKERITFLLIFWVRAMISSDSCSLLSWNLMK